MNGTIVTQSLSLGHALDVAGTASGVVHSVFERAVNLMVDVEMWTLLAESKSDLPFGIRVACPDFRPLGICPGDAVQVRAGFVSISEGGVRGLIDCRVARRWLPSFQPVVLPGLSFRVDALAALGFERCWPDSCELARWAMSALHCPRTLEQTLAKVVGAGPGATPSGDDVLVGTLAVLGSPHAGETGARSLRLMREALEPLLTTTTDVSAHLLRQAAHGFVSRDLHELLEALAGGSSPSRLQATIERVVETGATSGADACMGIAAAAPLFFIPEHEKAAA